MKNFRDAALASALNLALIIGFLCAVVWWIQTNFGALSALATVGGAVGAGLLYVGIRTGGGLVRDAQRTALENFTDGLAAVEQTRTASARGQNAAQTAQAQITVLDYKYQLQQQAQQQRMLTDARQQWEVELQQQAQQPAAAWAMDDADDGAGVRYYE
jgi:hypothetical protein